jgi:hypothetical protein
MIAGAPRPARGDGGRSGIACAKFDDDSARPSTRVDGADPCHPILNHPESVLELLALND